MCVCVCVLGFKLNSIELEKVGIKGFISFASVHIYIYIYIGSISSLMQISLNIIDILCLHIFFWIRSYSRITFIEYDKSNTGIRTDPEENM